MSNPIYDLIKAAKDSIKHTSCTNYWPNQIGYPCGYCSACKMRKALKKLHLIKDD